MSTPWVISPLRLYRKCQIFLCFLSQTQLENDALTIIPAMQQPTNAHPKANHHTTWWVAAIPMLNVNNGKWFSIKHTLHACKNMSASISNLTLYVLDCVEEINMYLYVLHIFSKFSRRLLFDLSPWKTTALLIYPAKLKPYLLMAWRGKKSRYQERGH